jgi:tetratricopeptide (TPR) repeat protein
MAQNRTRLAVISVLGLAAVGAVLLWALRPGKPGRPAVPTESPPEYAGSESCRECHQKAYDQWKDSHHAHAERAVDPVKDRAAFDPAREIKHGTQTTRVQIADGRFEIVAPGADKQVQTFVAERAIGVEPLYQYLVPGPRGQYQVTELAVDSKTGEWFDVFGAEDRKPGEWGHWTGRGMMWNTMCAGCHNTRVRKNYDRASDSYKTAMAERSVGCEACHGPMKPHVIWQHDHAKDGTRPRDPTLTRLTGEQYFWACGACHARRSDLTGDFQPGQPFVDHFAPAILDDSDTYYPDGQVRDEDFEYVSFLSSRMYTQGVRCGHCHDHHTGKTRPDGQRLCLQCHAGKIDPDAHGHHKAGTPGSFCVDCHMPQTPYMQRHLRRDHGLTIPDPQLTKDHNVPNACTRCHKDKSVDWAIEKAREWYGTRLDRWTQKRARMIVRARSDADDAWKDLLRIIREDPNPFWRAVAANLLGHYNTHTEVQDALLEATRHTEPLVRTMAARALNTATAHPAAYAALQRLLDDPTRMVRVDAAWALHARLDLDTRAGADLMAFLSHNADQPGGALQVGVLYLDRGNTEAALSWFRQAVSWDPNSAALRQALAHALSRTGDAAGAARQLEKASQLEPRNAVYKFEQGLALGETGEFELAVAAFKATVALEPKFARAWYNLGLAYSKLEDNAAALEALKQAETLDPRSAEFPYARAVILLNQERLKEAVEAAERTLQLDPAHAGARELLQRAKGQRP